jgi:16S rRNA (guanine527-N7)-methyltransferase
MDEAFITRIEQAAVEAAIPFSWRQAQACAVHIELMLRWNRRVDRTRITDHAASLSKHLLDSLVPAAMLPEEGAALDVGTGAGFPGVPLKILKGGIKMTLLDQDRKKASFLAQLCATLGLPDLDARHGKWESLWESAEEAGRYSLIVMRAVRLEQAHLTLLAARLLGPDGVFAFWAGPTAEKELEQIQDCAPELEFTGRMAYDLPGTSASRFLYTWRRNSKRSNA